MEKVQQLDKPTPVTRKGRKKQLDESIPIAKKGRKTSTARVVRVTHSKAVPIGQVSVGDVVLCKMRGFCPWPAYVTKLEGKSIFVEFFGDRTTQKTTITNLFSFQDSKDIILANIMRLKNPLFKKAVREAELVMGISEEYSIFVKTNM